MTEGKLYLIPVPISRQRPAQCLAPEVLESLALCRILIVENVRTARRFLSAAGYAKAIDHLIFHKMSQDTPESDWHAWLSNLTLGHHIGILSEAGMPCLADPGSKGVAIAHEIGAAVIPLPGPSSILQALVASGMNGQQFTFHGYLPRDTSGRRQALLNLEKETEKSGYTQIFMETPYRNDVLFQDILTVLKPSTVLGIAAHIGEEDATIRTLRIDRWRKKKATPGKLPCIFLLYCPVKTKPEKRR